MKHADYEKIPGLNWSTLKRIHTSALLVRYRADHPEPDKPSFVVGRATHVAVLEPKRFTKAYVVMPGFSGKGMKAAKAEWLENVRVAESGAEVIKEDDHAMAERVRDAVRGHRAASKLLDHGRAEVTATWSVGGVSAKARIDWLRPMGILEFKTTRQTTLRAFANDAARMLYHGQVAWYHDGAVAAGLIPDPSNPPIIIAAQTVEPYDVAVLRVGEVELEAGRRLYLDLLEQYTQCQAAGYWPGICPGIEDLNLPGWAPGMQPNYSDDNAEEF